MAGPWEKYQSQPGQEKQADGPWSKYSTSAESQKGATAKQRSALEEAGRQVGLTARYALEGVGGAFDSLVGNPLRTIARPVFGNDATADTGGALADVVGLPRPETPTERVVGAVARGVAAGGAGAGVAGQVANAARGATQAIAQQLAAQPGLQAAAAGAAGGASQLTAENGGGPGAQLAAALAAGVAVPAVAAGASRVSALRNAAIPAEQQAVLDAGQAAGVPVMTSDVLPPDTAIGKLGRAAGERVPFVGTGPVRSAQQVARQNAVSNIADDYGIPNYEAIVSSIKGKTGAIKQAAGRVIDQAGRDLDAVGPVAPSKSIQAIDDAVARLSDPNIRNPQGDQQIRSLLDLRDTLSNGQQTFSTLRVNRTNLREELDSVDAAGRSQFPSYAKKLVGNVYSALKSDMDDFASANLSPDRLAKLERANQVYGNQAQLLRNSRLKNVLDKGDITPEAVKNLIYSAKPSENQILYNSLGTSGRAQVRSALIDDAATKAMRGGEINPNAFGAELAKHGKKIDIFFKGAERDSIKGLIRLLQVTRRAQDAAVAPTTTGATLTPYALGASAYADLGATVATATATGGLSRIYESAPVRNLLLRLGTTQARSAREADYVRAIAAALRDRTERQPMPQQQQAPMPVPALADAQDSQN